MDRFETLHIYQQPKFQDLAVYVRYIDDTGTVLKSRKYAMDMLTYLNDQHKSIKFEMELPDKENFLPMLDVRIGIDGDGSDRRKLYTKPANKGITLHAESHHPLATKRAVIQNEMQRAVDNSTCEFRRKAIAQLSSLQMVTPMNQ